MEKSFHTIRKRGWYLEPNSLLLRFGTFVKPYSPQDAIVATSRTDQLFWAPLVGLYEFSLPYLRRALADMEEIGALTGEEPKPPKVWPSMKWCAQEWWYTFAIGQWLLRGTPREADFAKALDFVHLRWSDIPEEPPALPYYLMLCLAARRYEMAEWLCSFWQNEFGALPSTAHPRPLADFGRWACRHLAAGGRRDEEFIARGVNAMRDADDGNTYGACLLLLWLKAVYWDSGVVATPKETALKLYEALPNIERPDLHDIRE